MHCHTTCSDGTMTPRELIFHAKEVGLSGICITDHDTIQAYGEAPPIAKELGLALGNGVEFSSTFSGLSVHILGYDFDLTSPHIHGLCARHQQRRAERNQKILEKLRRLGMFISEEELLSAGAHVIGRPHIADLMVKKGHVKTIQQAFNLYIGDGKPCFDVGTSISSEETISILHQAGGKAFLAHPHHLKGGHKMRELLALPFDGLECYYARFPENKQQRFVKIAKEKGWLISGGSDFHGKVKEYIELGCSWVDEQHFYKIFQRL